MNDQFNNRINDISIIYIQNISYVVASINIISIFSLQVDLFDAQGNIFIVGRYAFINKTLNRPKK